MKFLFIFFIICTSSHAFSNNATTYNIYQITDYEKAAEKADPFNDYQCQKLVKDLEWAEGEWAQLREDIRDHISVPANKILSLGSASLYLKPQKIRSISLIITKTNGDSFEHTRYLCDYPILFDANYASFSLETPKNPFSVETVTDKFGTQYNFSGIRWFKGQTRYNPVGFDYFELEWYLKANILSKKEIKDLWQLPSGIKIDQLSEMKSEDCMIASIRISSNNIGHIEVMQNREHCLKTGHQFLQKPLFDENYSYSILREGLYFEDCQSKPLYREDCITFKKRMLRKILEASFEKKGHTDLSINLHSSIPLFHNSEILISFDLDDEYLEMKEIKLNGGIDQASSSSSTTPIISSIVIDTKAQDNPKTWLSDFCKDHLQRSKSILQFFGLQLSEQQLEEFLNDPYLEGNWTVSKEVKITFLVAADDHITPETCSIPLVWRML